MANQDSAPRKRNRFMSVMHILKELWWLWLLIIVVGIVLKLFYLIIAGAAFLIVCGIIVLVIKLALISNDEPSRSDRGDDG